MRSSRTRTPVTRLPSTSTRAGALTRTSWPRCRSQSRAGSAYSSSSGTAGSTSAAAIGSANIRWRIVDEVASRRLVDRLIERGQRQRLPEQLDQALWLSVPVQPIAHRLPVVGHSAGDRRVRAALGVPLRSAFPTRRIASRSPQPSASHAITPPSKCSGDGHRRQLQHASRSRADRSSAATTRPATARDRMRRSDRGRRGSVRNSPSGCAARCRPARPVSGSRNDVARPPSPGRASSTSTRAPASANAAAALNPAKPAPMTIASGAHARAERRKPMAESWAIAQIVRAIRARMIFGTRITSVNTS